MSATEEKIYTRLAELFGNGASLEMRRDGPRMFTAIAWDPRGIEYARGHASTRHEALRKLKHTLETTP